MSEYKKDLMDLCIHTPKGKIYTGKILSLSSENEFGIFDILYGHQDLISIITNRVLITDEKENVKNFKIDEGVLKCSGNKIDIYLKMDQL